MIKKIIAVLISLGMFYSLFYIGLTVLDLNSWTFIPNLFVLIAVTFIGIFLIIGFAFTE